MKTGTHDDYQWSIDDANHVPLTVDQLERAAREADDGDVIFVPGGRHLKWVDTIELDSVVLASQGATLECPEDKDGDLLRTFDCAVDGFCLEGPRKTWAEWQGYDGPDILSRGINANGDSLISNCSFRHWAHAGVTVGRKAASDVTLERCDLVDNAMEGWGYGVETADVLEVRQCYMDGNRHSVAAQGGTGASWTVVDSHQGPRSHLHAFDTHKPNLESITFKRNYSELSKTNTVRVRGDVDEGGEITNNWFVNERHGDPGGPNTACRAPGNTTWEGLGITYRDNLHSSTPPSEVFHWSTAE